MSQYYRGNDGSMIHRIRKGGMTSEFFILGCVGIPWVADAVNKNPEIDDRK